MPSQPARSRSRVKLRPQNPFDLIRLLARSQPDPRKAVAELVQNSLDAGARQIEIVWFNEKGRRGLAIHDDGEGVFPELDRGEALRQIARTIGHSHKRDLTPAQRREQMVLGQYGIGLIGFWSVGEVLEMKSRVDGGRALVLRLREDHSEGEVYTSRSRLIGEGQTFTEITIRGVHPGAVNKIKPARLQAYLAHELRGRLLQRDAVVTIRDRVARGRARKLFTVQPQPYLGQPIAKWRELAVPGFEAARVELYLIAPEEERQGLVSLCCGGTVVMDDIAEIDGVDVPRAPWSEGQFEGVIDFPELHVSPGARRGFSHGEPVEAFLTALAGLEEKLAEHLAQESRERSQAKQEQVAKEIRKAFRSVVRRLPEYDFFGVERRSSGTDGKAGEDGLATDAAQDRPVPLHTSPEDQGAALSDASLAEAPQPAAAQPPVEDSENLAPDEAPPEGAFREDPVDDGQLFPPGPLASVTVTPRSLRIAPLRSRRLRARARDADGRPCAGEVTFAWSSEGPGEMQWSDCEAHYTAPAAAFEPGQETLLEVSATQGEVVTRAEVTVHCIDPSHAERVAGIPEPHPVMAPAESWRSRLVNGRWEYNAAHRDYLAVSESATRRLRYLIHLFAKEVVLRNFGRPGDDEILERMVEILASLDTVAKR